MVDERFRFYTREQYESENVDHFIQDLKKHVKTCEFKEQEDNMIRWNRIVFGVNDKALQEKLLNIPELNLEKAVEVAKNSEIVKEQLKEEDTHG